MHRSIPLAGVLALTCPLFAMAQEPPRPSRELPRAVAPPVIGTQQIDRYDAIANVQEALKANPNSLADWIILGELAHEVALDAPPDLAPKYFTMSRDAYEKALTLAPNNAGLKAAVQFARDQEANSATFEKARDRATQAYLDARRRDLAATNFTPTVRVFNPPAVVPGVQPATSDLSPINPATTVAPVRPPTSGSAVSPRVADTLPTPAGVTASVPTDPDTAPGAAPAVTTAPAVVRDTANLGTRQIYSTAPTYQAYALPQGTPYTFQQYTSTYYPPGNYPAGTLPMTVQRYNQQYANPLFNPLGPPVVTPRVVPPRP